MISYSSLVFKIIHSGSKYLLLNNLIFAFKTLIASKIYKRPNLISLCDDNNKLIRLKFLVYH
jgi:hypothetical protein